jgi:hypothetical protein
MIDSACACDAPRVRLSTDNRPGLRALSYRVGDYGTVLAALLQPATGESELSSWSPSAKGDLALQLVEWWAYIADVLTFYNERIANEGYLRTAVRDDSVRTLVELLGYRPRPAIAAVGTLGALVARVLTIPPGFQVQSKPSPGHAPQIFELDAATVVHPGNGAGAGLVGRGNLLLDDGVSVLVEGVVAGLKAGDELLFVPALPPNHTTRPLLKKVAAVAHVKDGRGLRNTKITFEDGHRLNGLSVDGLRLMKSKSTTGIWTGAGIASGDQFLWLSGSNRQILPGDIILLDNRPVHPTEKAYNARGEPQFVVLLRVFSTQEVVNWIQGPVTPPPAPSQIPVVLTQLNFKTTPDRPKLEPLIQGTSWRLSAPTMKILYGWREVGRLLGDPPESVSDAIWHAPVSPHPRHTPPPTPKATLDSIPPNFPVGGVREVLLEDVGGAGATANATAAGRSLQLDGLPTTPDLRVPIHTYYDLLPVSRGASVHGEVLGSGDASATGQEFVLKKSPLTYLSATTDAPGIGGQMYRSTLSIRVAGVRWTEVPSFYGAGPTDQIFVTREDLQGKTHVLFGDGNWGARLPAGSANVIAEYRHGGGGDMPPAGALTVAVKSISGLRSVKNPVAVWGGSDPDPATKLRRYAPNSALTFGRAISGEDFEAIAAQAPSVTRARARWTWDVAQRRSTVVIFVGDTDSAREAAQQGIDAARDPNRPVIVQRADERSVALDLTVGYDPRYDPALAQAAVAIALTDDDTGVFGVNRLQIGETVYRSAIEAACLSVRGAMAVTALSLAVDGVQLEETRWDPGSTAYFRLAASPTVTMQEWSSG